MAKSTKTVKTLVGFDEITELAIQMPGCKMLLYYTDANGNKNKIHVEGMKDIKLISDSAAKSRTQESLPTRGGKITIKGSKK